MYISSRDNRQTGDITFHETKNKHLTRPTFTAIKGPKRA